LQLCNCKASSNVAAGEARRRLLYDLHATRVLLGTSLLMTEPFAPPVGCNARIVYEARPGPVSSQETPDERLLRLYASEGGPLLGWLIDECARRGQTLRELADQLGVTYSYIYQLRSGARQTAHVSPDFAGACSKYLGVPPVVVKLLAGALPVSDFVWPHRSEDEVMNRALDAMKLDPVAQALLPANVHALPLDAKRSLVLMYAESSRQDILGVRNLPDVLRWLQRAAVTHDDNEARATS
jgi:transcriptional regulator with XRE-family HTH domain